MLSLNLGPLVLALDHLLLLGALIIASLVGWRVAKRGSESPESALFNLFLFGVLCARLAFVVEYWAQYREELVRIVDLRDGGFSAWAGVLGVLLGALLYARRRIGLRRPLAWALFSGALFWGLASAASHLYQQSARLPLLTLADAQGTPVPLASYRGQPLVVNIWATWCPPCRREMPVLQQAQHAYPGVTFLFVNQGETPEMVGTFLTTTGLDLTHVLFDGTGQVSRQVGSMALPTTLFYDAEGRLLGSHLGELSPASLRNALKAFPGADTPTALE